MKRTTSYTARAAAVSLAAGALFLVGCNNAAEGALSGAAIGAGSGAAIGSLSGDVGKGAAYGAIGGAVLGAFVGDQNERNARNAQQRGYYNNSGYYDRQYYGEPYHNPQPRRSTGYYPY